MFETTEDEQHDGEKDGGDFALDGAGGGGHPDGDTNKEVAHDAFEHGFEKAEVDFGVSGGGDGVWDLVKGAADDCDGGDQECANEVAKEDE